MDSLNDLGFDYLTHVQTYLQVLIEEKSNFVVQSYSGSGKTIAMAIIMLSCLEIDCKFPHIICIVPTAESAMQMRNVIHKIGRYQSYSLKLLVPGEGGKVNVYIIIFNFIHSL